VALVFLCAPVSPFRDAVARALEAAGHKVRCVADVVSLFADLQGTGTPRGRERADCVLLDETATGGTAGLYSAALRLRGMGVGAIPTIAVIDRPEPEARAATLQVTDDVLSRPAHLVEAVARIESLLRGRAASANDRGDDATTGLRGRGFLDERLAEEWRRSTRFSEPLAFLVAGLGGGSRTGDRGMREISAALRRSLRQIDVLGRFGAFEVAALLVNTHLAGAITCAERLKKELTTPQAAGTDFAIGLSFYPGKDVTSPADLVRTAEKALARAANEGPGSICLIQHQSYLFQRS
jgi:diguanylate cyclase (GGDEF)-like protein